MFKISKITKRNFNIFRLLAISFSLLFGLFIGVAGILIYSAWRDLPSWEMGALQPGTPSVLCDVYGEPFAQLGLENYIAVNYTDVPLALREAVLSTEDARFYKHHGVDIRSIMRALFADFTRQKVVQGGSTITQQVAKNTFLTPERTLKRKIQEALLAVQLERYYSKDEIFAAYLNCIYYGEGARGIGAAAMTYFNKKVNGLTLTEAALLAGLPQAPSYYSPFQNYQAALERRNDVLDMMVKRGFITSELGQRSKKEPINLGENRYILRPLTSYPYPYFTDYVIQQLAKKYDDGYLYRGGLKIYTTLDQKIQTASEQAASSSASFPLSINDKEGLLQPQAAIVFVDPKNGDVKALVGGREHTASQVYNRATMAYRQPGSAFKPILVYAPALEYLNMTPDTTIKDEPVSFKDYKPRNYDGRYRGTITLREALANSVNIPAIKILNQVGLERAVTFASQLGFTTLDSNKEGLSAALGGLHKGVTPLQMAAAYAAFANGGNYFEPRVVTKITLANGTVLESVKSSPRRVMKPRTAQMITNMLQAAVNYGTGTGARIYGLELAGKTGTTDQGKDAWFCGYTPGLAGIVWMGWDLPRSMPGASGGSYCAPVLRRILMAAFNYNPSEQPRKQAAAGESPGEQISPDTKQTVDQESVNTTKDKNNNTPKTPAETETQEPEEQKNSSPSEEDGQKPVTENKAPLLPQSE